MCQGRVVLCGDAALMVLSAWASAHFALTWNDPNSEWHMGPCCVHLQPMSGCFSSQGHQMTWVVTGAAGAEGDKMSTCDLSQQSNPPPLPTKQPHTALIQAAWISAVIYASYLTPLTNNSLPLKVTLPRWSVQLPPAELSCRLTRLLTTFQTVLLLERAVRLLERICGSIRCDEAVTGDKSGCSTWSGRFFFVLFFSILLPCLLTDFIYCQRLN